MKYKGIIIELNIHYYFKEVHGSPKSKFDAIKMVLNFMKNDPKNAIMIGDSYNDYEAAVGNDILFALRRAEFNLPLQEELDCLKFKDFDDE